MKELFITVGELFMGLADQSYLEKALAKFTQNFKSECFCLTVLDFESQDADIVLHWGCNETERKTLLKNLKKNAFKQKFLEKDNLVLTSSDFLKLINKGSDNMLLKIYESYWLHSKPSYYLFSFFQLPVGVGICAFRRSSEGKNIFEKDDKETLSMLHNYFKAFLSVRNLCLQWRDANWFINLFKKNGLTQREIEIIFLMLEGKAPKEISDELSIQINTVRDHIKRIYKKLGIHSQIELFAMVYRLWDKEVKKYLSKQ